MSSPVSYFTSLPPVTRTLLTSTCLLTVFSFILRETIAPHDIGPFWSPLGVHINHEHGVQIPWIELQVAGLYWRPWTLVTCAFMERGFISLAFTLFFQAVYGSRLETAWGSREFAKFVLTVLMVSRSALVVLTFLWSFIAADPEFLTYYNATYGFGPAQLAFLVADCQQRPNTHLQTFFPSVKLPVRLLPLLCLIFPLIQFLTGGWTPSLFSTFFDFWLSWAYLRWFLLFPRDANSFALSTGGPTRGDRSGDWAFSEWFWWNATLQRGVALVGDKLWDLVGSRIGLGELVRGGAGAGAGESDVETRESTTSSWAGLGSGNTLGAAPAERAAEEAPTKKAGPSEMVEVVVVKQ